MARLELVLAGREDAQGVALDLHLDLLEALAQELVHGLGLVVWDALRDGHSLPDRPAQRRVDLAVLQRLERHLAAHELLLEEIDDLLQLALVVGDEHESVALERHRAHALLEVVARGDLLLGHVDGVAHLVDVGARYHVERRFLGHLTPALSACRPWRDSRAGRPSVMGTMRRPSSADATAPRVAQPQPELLAVEASWCCPWSSVFENEHRPVWCSTRTSSQQSPLDGADQRTSAGSRASWTSRARAGLEALGDGDGRHAQRPRLGDGRLAPPLPPRPST